SAQRAGDRVFTSRARVGSVRTLRVFTGRPSTLRFHAASNRSRASAAGPTRISRTLAKRASRRAHVLLEVVAQLLDRPERIRQRFAAHPPAPVRILDQIAVAQAVARSLSNLTVRIASSRITVSLTIY